MLKIDMNLPQHKNYLIDRRVKIGQIGPIQEVVRAAPCIRPTSIDLFQLNFNSALRLLPIILFN